MSDDVPSLLWSVEGRHDEDKTSMSGEHQRIHSYLPHVAQDPSMWNALDEDERVFLVSAWHKKHSDAHPAIVSLRGHALAHVVAENMLTSGEVQALSAMRTMVDQGLTRHEAIHALSDAIVACLLDLAAKGEVYSEERFAQEISRLDVNFYFDTTPE